MIPELLSARGELVWVRESPSAFSAHLRVLRCATLKWMYACQTLKRPDVFNIHHSQSMAFLSRVLSLGREHCVGTSRQSVGRVMRRNRSIRVRF